MQARARADGHLSGRERARIDHAQDRLSRNIYRESHDRQTSRNSGQSHRPHGWDRGNGHSWNRGPSHGASTAPRTGSDSHAGRSDRFAGRQAPMQQAQALSTPSPRSTTGGTRGTDSGRRSR